MTKLTKYIYIQIIYNFNNKNINELLELIKKYKKPVINSIIRQTILHTHNFNYAMKLNDSSNSEEIFNVLNEIFSSKYIKIDKLKLSELYEKSPLKKEITKHEIFKLFKPLFTSKLYEYKLIFFNYINSKLIFNILGSSKYKQQSFLETKFNINNLIINKENLNNILKLLIENKVYINNIYVNSNEFIITNEYYNIPKQINDIELENILLIKLKSIDILKQDIINVYESLTITEETKKRTKLLIKLLNKKN